MSSSPEYLTTKEVAELLRLKERKVYDLAAEGTVPCTRATGKLLFSRTAIDQWLQQNSNHSEVSVVAPLITGSHDPLLEWAVRESQCGIATSFDGSVDGLQKFSSQQATVAALHLYAPEDKSWNVAQVAHHSIASTGVLVNWIYRQRGLVYQPGLDLQCIADVKHLRVAARQQGAGSQILLEALMKDAEIDIESINCTITARSETDTVLAVVDGTADCTLGLQSLAEQHQLGFTPLVQEPLDLLVDRRFWFEPAMQRFITFCRSEVFKLKVDSLAGYRMEEPFQVRFNS